MIFDSFDWMKGEPKLVGVDGYPIYESDPYYTQHLSLDEILTEALLPEFWWQNANIGLESSVTTIYCIFDISAWQRLSQSRIKIISEKDTFILKTIFACYLRVCWLNRNISGIANEEDKLDRYLQELKGLNSLSEPIDIIIPTLVDMSQIFLNEGIKANPRNKYLQVLYGISENLVLEITSLSNSEVIDLIDVYTKGIFLHSSHSLSKSVSSKIMNLINKLKPFSVELEIALHKIKSAAIIQNDHDNYKKWTTFLEKALEEYTLLPGDVWSDRLLQDLEPLDNDTKKAWQELILHAGTADKSKPTAKWNKKAKELITEIGEESFVNYCLKWFPLVAEPREDNGKGFSDTSLYIDLDPKDAVLLLHDKNCLLLKGLVWSCSNLEDNRLIPAFGALAETCYRKIPQIGARSQLVGNACIYALSVMSGREAITQLEKLQAKIKYSQAKSLIQKAFETAAKRQGITKEDLLELAVPNYGLNENGLLRQSFGSFTAEVKILSSTRVDLQWYKPDGKLQKSLPAEVKNNYSSELKALKRHISEIESLLKVHRDRLENTYLQPRTWKYTDWQERFSHHPLLGYLTNRLVWEFRNETHQETGIWHQNQVVNAQGQALTWLETTEEVNVVLWHPIFADSTLISSWRDWLEQHQICQPFKQAYREIYPLTEAERTTRTYSNRFAAHILRQHQMYQLMKQKGWQYSLQGGFDGANNAIFHLPQSNLQAEFYVDPAGEEVSDVYIYLYVASDRVCFYDQRYTPIPLEDVPALTFSEVMRNVDLFVGVASIGNDPNWSDRGENLHNYDNYWEQYSFGELAMTAQLRREVITRLLPKLKISDRCKIDDRFLIVEGKRRTYKIHFGSGNILMEPNNSYLCIVAGWDKSSNTDSLFLPFEGDNTLSLILSKAFLLADDDKIKDSSILSQIGRH
ncbi:hypothetical protein Syn7502_02219 [Synechococcus sp. PCC 7502]|uniref:DUF4132 domain-containing protein n=1 Tax=Synechococcus sp. PCC 7502 TaxID=1173263 RepID=UPI00029FF9A5|nr:DUF4132 domain-containing protein [Synechococcus sp. PCC 7502]AFY74227.1 hypothetical protein Syn7502_02219 [Synechococcus sp. PCC 7502]